MKVANNFESFVEKITNAEMKALNSDEGQQLVAALQNECLNKNPEMTVEEWEKVKQQFMVFVFHSIIKNDKNLMNELAAHTYNALKEEE